MRLSTDNLVPIQYGMPSTRQYGPVQHNIIKTRVLSPNETSHMGRRDRLLSQELRQDFPVIILASQLVHFGALHEVLGHDRMANVLFHKKIGTVLSCRI